jgi:hypothetical protein
LLSLLDSLSTFIRIQLSGRACEGAWAGPDAMLVDFVFKGGPAGTAGLANGLPACRTSLGLIVPIL